MIKKSLIAAALLSATCLPGVLHATESAGGQTAVAAPGQKLDSGLGELGHYRNWPDQAGRPARFVTGARIGVLRAN